MDAGLEHISCLKTDWMLDEDAWVTALEVVPQHADSTFRATVTFSQEGVCDALGVTAQNVFDYHRTNPRLELRPGDALRLPANTRINVQVHYNSRAATAQSTGTQPTEIWLWTLAKGARPSHEVARATFQQLNINIPVDAVGIETRTSAEIDAMYTPPGAQIIAVTPALHTLGQKITAQLVAPNGAETTILELQDWTLDARKDYLLDPAGYVAAPSGSQVKWACTYSNRLEDQALDTDGDPLEPKVTTFGEDSRSEQCRLGILFRFPL